MAQSDYPVVQQLEEQLGQIRERLGRKERRGGWWIVFSGLSLGALAGSALAYYLRSRDEEPSYSPPPAPPTPRRDDAIVLKAAPTPAAAPAPANDDKPIELKSPATTTGDTASVVAAPAVAETLTTVPVTAEEAIEAIDDAPVEAEPANEAPRGAVVPDTAATTAPAADRQVAPPVEEATETPESDTGPDEEPIETVEFGGMTVASAPVVTQYEGALPPTNDQCPASHPIKGNLSRNNVLIFHIPGSNNYERTKPEACFATEADAEAAGFRKARS